MTILKTNGNADLFLSGERNKAYKEVHDYAQIHDKNKNNISIFSLSSYIHMFSRHIIESYHDIREKIKDLTITNFNLGLYHFYRGNFSDSYLRFKIILFFKPQYKMAHYYLARSMFEKKQKEDAIPKAVGELDLILSGERPECTKEYMRTRVHDKIKKQFFKCEGYILYLQNIIDKGYGCDESSYLLSILANPHNLPDFIPTRVVRDYFEMEALNPHNPHDYYNSKILFDLYDDLEGKIIKPPIKMLDIGCGTGILSSYFKEKYPYYQISAIDISEEMIHIAGNLMFNQKHVFDNLHHIDMLNYLNSTKEKYDLVVAGASLHYDKDLADNLKLIKNSLNDKSIVAFSVEKSQISYVEFNSKDNNYCFNLEFIEDSIKMAGFNKIHISEHHINDSKNYWFILIGLSS